jgi:hypothetical protein
VTSSPDALAEIRQLVEGALARHGTAGTVQVNVDSVMLVGSGPTVSVSVSRLLPRWEQLPFPERQRECGVLARDLSRQRRPLVPGGSRRQTRSFGLLVIAGLALAGAALYWRLSSRAQPVTAAAPLPALSALERAEEERQQRAARVCNATRTRVARGATVGPTDVEGWVVELALVRDAAQTPWAGVGAFVTDGQADGGGRIVWSGAPELRDLTGSGTKVSVRERRWSGAARQFDELVLTFYGEYVLPYFRERERIRLVRLAHALATSENATLGALYGRCAEGSAHHMGSWFLGSSPAAATASLLYFMGAHADPPQLPSELLSDQPGEALVPAFALTKLLELTRRLERQEVAALLGGHDGMVAGPPQFTTLGFPFVDSDRAWRASHKIIRALGH